MAKDPNKQMRDFIGEAEAKIDAAMSKGGPDMTQEELLALAQTITPAQATELRTAPSTTAAQRNKLNALRAQRQQQLGLGQTTPNTGGFAPPVNQPNPLDALFQDGQATDKAQKTDVTLEQILAKQELMDEKLNLVLELFTTLVGRNDERDEASADGEDLPGSEEGSDDDEESDEVRVNGSDRHLQWASEEKDLEAVA